ncbi:hypothetical protein [Mariniblastus fucicola]|uniref:Uncharacterized protein n=1 Tax=Mariniblastus fucicola TaxID=980251 RepID=A0A5B9P2A8_9BACT|nr:hypothetical protein [Mariniblastus fucicola]QEG20647.1 hypothetical protein MFFC18_04970 [Mariniblastus fucicola]
MPRTLSFNFGGSQVDFEMHKVDRTRLYGFKETLVLDEDGEPCELNTLAEDGKTLIGKGGTGIGYVDADGNWVEKADLTAVDLAGNKIVPVPSSFAAPIELGQRADSEDFLNHNIRLIYRLESEELDEKLAAELSEGAIFKFPYSFRGGLEADAGFLLHNEAGEIFFLVGDASSVEYVGLQQAAPTAAETTGDDASADDLMDFGMI